MLTKTQKKKLNFVNIFYAYFMCKNATEKISIEKKTLFKTKNSNSMQVNLMNINVKLNLNS